MSLPSYVLYGLTVQSEVPLFEPQAGSGGAADVLVEVGTALDHDAEEPAGERLASYRFGTGAGYLFIHALDGSYVLRYEKLCDFVVSPGLDRVTVRSFPGANDGTVSVLIAGTVLSFVLITRDEPVLHASAVQVGDQAVAFVGYSGMGKSTMATLLCAAGGRLVTDDVLRLDLGPTTSGQPPTCYLGPTEVRLRKAASELVDLFGDQPRRRTTGDARDALQVRNATTERLPLAAIVIPRPQHDIDEVAVTRLPAKDAMLTLLRFPRIVGWEAGAVIGAEFQHVATVASAVPVYTADIPWGPPFSEAIAPTLLDAIGAGLPVR